MTPIVSYQFSATQFIALLRVLRVEMNEHHSNIDTADRHEVLLFEMNYWLMISWLERSDKAIDKKQIKVKMDLMYAKAFVEYWTPVSLPDYEDVLLRKTIVGVNRSIELLRSKRKFINL